MIVNIFFSRQEPLLFLINIEDPDQTPRVAAFDEGLHCLSASLSWDMRHKLSYSTGKIREIFVKICMGTW